MKDHKRRDDMERQERRDGHAGTEAAVMRRINDEGWRQRKKWRDRWVAFADAAYTENGNVGITFMLRGADEYNARVLRDKVKAVLLPGGSLKESPEASRLVRDATDGLLRASGKARRLGKENGIVTLAVEVSGEFAARHLGGGRHED